jgi:hypothetical protein
VFRVRAVDGDCLLGDILFVAWFAFALRLPRACSMLAKAATAGRFPSLLEDRTNGKDRRS